MKKRFNIFLGALLCLCLILSAKPIPASADPLVWTSQATVVKPEKNRPAARAITARADSASGWIDGGVQSHSATCIVDGFSHILINDWVGYYGAHDGSSPKVGEVFYVHIVVYNPSPCSNATVSTEIVLPTGLVSAVDATNKLYCFRLHLPSGGRQEIAGSTDFYNCPANPASGVYGLNVGWSFVGGTGYGWEVALPVIATREFAGMGSSPLQGVVNLTAADWATYAPYSTYPSSYVWVAANPPSFEYPSPATVDITNTTAKAMGTVYSRFTPGNLYLDFGPTTAYGYFNGPLALNNTVNWQGVESVLTGLTSGTTYHWRLRFVTEGGVTYTGADQTFTTTGAPPAAVYTLTFTSSAGGTVAASPNGGSYAAGTAVTLTATAANGYVFSGWTLDGAPAGSANPYSVTMDANHTLHATFVPANGVATDADLALSITDTPDPVVAGGTITYVLTVANNGPADAANVVVTDVLPSGTAFVSADATCSHAAGTATCALGALASGANRTLTIAVSAAAGTITNQASVRSDTPDANTANNIASTTTTVAATASLTIGAGAGAPADGEAQKGATGVVMGQFALAAASGEDLRWKKITVKAGGSGQDVADIKAVKLFLDKNGNGSIDSDDTQLAAGKFGSDDGALDLALTAPHVIAAGTTSNIIVVYDFNTVLARAWPLAPFSLALIGIAIARPRRFEWRWAMLVLVAVAMGCNGGGGGTGGSSAASTYSLVVHALAVEGVTSATAQAVGGLPVSGRTVSIAR